MKENSGSSRAEKALLLSIVLLVNLAAFAQIGLIYEFILGAVLALAIILRKRRIIHFSLLFFLMSMMRVTLPGLTGEMPSLKALAPLAASTLLLLPFPHTAALGWLRAGRIDGRTLALSALTCAVSAASLVVWALWTPNLGEGPRMAAFFSGIFPKWAIFAFGVPLFALVNAFSEEAVYRGLSQEVIGAVSGSGRFALVLQSTLYAAAHFVTGFPNGYAGYLMTFSYGLVLGYMRRRTDGILAPYLTHIAADLTIGYFLTFRLL